MNETEKTTAAQWRRLTDERIAAIRNTGNTAIPAGAKAYYVSPSGDDKNDGESPERAWRTLEKVNSADLRAGSFVCFERGGLWRRDRNAKGSTLCLRGGVTYTAYGDESLPKPCLVSSVENGADPAKWREVAPHVWEYTGFTTDSDIGTVVFNEGERHAFKVTLRQEPEGILNHLAGTPFGSYRDLCRDLDFFHYFAKIPPEWGFDMAPFGEDCTGKLFLFSIGNPGERFTSIEFNVGVNLLDVRENAVTVENLALKYTGFHAIGAGTVKDLTVRNCEIGWIGGSVHGLVFGRNWLTRLGNGVEIYGGCDGYTVENNYLYQCYDAGITQQVNVGGKNVLFQKDMTYRNNVIENCNYSIEYFLSDCPAENPSRMERFLIENNLMWNAARGFCEDRYDAVTWEKGYGAHVKGRCSANGNRATDYVIRGNLFAGSQDKILDISSNRFNPDGSGSMPHFAKNVFLQEMGAWFGQVNQCGTAEAQVRAEDDYRRYTEEIPTYLRELSDGSDRFLFPEARAESFRKN